MTSAHDNQNFIIASFINEAMFIGNSSGSESREAAFERFGFAGALEWFALNFFYQAVDSLKNLSAGRCPFDIIFKRTGFKAHIPHRESSFLESDSSSSLVKRTTLPFSAFFFAASRRERYSLPVSGDLYDDFFNGCTRMSTSRSLPNKSCSVLMKSLLSSEIFSRNAVSIIKMILKRRYGENKNTASAVLFD